MNVEDFRTYCLSQKGVTEEFPFGEDTLVFKVMGKVFALTNLNSDEFKVNLKCAPDKAIELREEFPEIQSGYHMNKKHWNTVSFEESLDDNFLEELVKHSYDLVVKKLKKMNREFLENL
jgi:predicted DNA-binding protein (MmcQ/YjbR family)